MAGSADAIGSGPAAATSSGRATAAPQAEPDTHARTYRLYDREVGFTLAMFVVSGLLLWLGPLHEPILFVFWALVVNGALFGAQLALSWRRGGMVKVDPVGREVTWSRPSADGPTQTWRFDEITAIDTPRKGGSDVVRLHTATRKLLLQVPTGRAAVIADWLGEALESPKAPPAA